MNLAQRWAAEIERLMASSRACSKPGCGRRVVWRAGHNPLRHLAGVCYVCWGEHRRDSAGPSRQARRQWRRVAQASWCSHCATTVPWAAHWIALGHCRVRQEEFEAERAKHRARLGSPVVRPAPSLDESPSTRNRPANSTTVVCPPPTPRRPAPNKTAPAATASRSSASDRITRAESLAAQGVRDAWRRADRFVETARDADRVAALILADDTVLVEGGFVIRRATGTRLAAVGGQVQAAVARVSTSNKAHCAIQHNR